MFYNSFIRIHSSMICRSTINQKNGLNLCEITHWLFRLTWCTLSNNFVNLSAGLYGDNCAIKLNFMVFYAGWHVTNNGDLSLCLWRRCPWHRVYTTKLNFQREKHCIRLRISSYRLVRSMLCTVRKKKRRIWEKFIIQKQWLTSRAMLMFMNERATCCFRRNYY